MAKPYEITLSVEEIALGSVLRKLHEMPGVAKVDLNLGHGGTGSGAKQLTEAAAAKGGTIAERVIRLLIARGPLKRGEIRKHIGLTEGSINTGLADMKKKGLVEALGKGVYGLSAALRARAGANGAAASPLALPAPVTAAKDASGRMLKGNATGMLLAILVPAPLARQAVGDQLHASGMTRKNIVGVLVRAQHRKLIKRHGDGTVELTEKGRKHAAGATAHG